MSSTERTATAKLRHIPLAELIEHCRAQTSEYLHSRQEGDTTYCLEIFRRAAQEGDEEAWAFIYAFYSTEEFLGGHYLLKWVRSWLNGRHGPAIRLHYTEEEMIQEIWLRFMRSDAAKEFRFKDMRHLMAFLRRLTNNFALDAASRKAPQALHSLNVDQPVNGASTTLSARMDNLGSVAEYVANKEAMASLLRSIVGVLITTDREWWVFRGSFLDELPPRKLYELHPGVFSSGEVETIRRRLVRRLRKSPILLSRYVKLVVLRDDERQNLVFDYALLQGWPNQALVERFPTLFRDRREVAAVRCLVLQALRTRFPFYPHFGLLLSTVESIFDDVTMR